MSEQVRHKRGDIGPDGRLFWGYKKSYKTGEQWISVDTFRKYEAYQKAYNKARYQTPERKAYQKARYQTPEFKAYQQTQEYKAYQKAYKQTPEAKAAQKSYSAAHYQNLRKEQYTADAFRMMQSASELSKALTNLPNTNTK